MQRFYLDTTDGSYLVVDHGTADYYDRIGKPDLREARAVAIAGQRSSVQTTSVSIFWLRENCKPRRREEVPKAWLDVLVGE